MPTTMLEMLLWLPPGLENRWITSASFKTVRSRLQYSIEQATDEEEELNPLTQWGASSSKPVRIQVFVFGVCRLTDSNTNS